MAAAAQRSAGLPEDYPADRLGLPGKTPRIRAVWAENGHVDHTPAFYASDQQGREQKTNLTTMAYDSVGREAQILAQEAASLLPGHPRLASQRLLVYISGIAYAGAPGSRDVLIRRVMGPGCRYRRRLPVAGPELRSMFMTR